MNQPRVSTLELLKRVRDEAKPIDYKHLWHQIPVGLLGEITHCIELAEQSTMTPERVTAAPQQTDALFSAIQGVLNLPPYEALTTNRWLVCVYCSARSSVPPLQHRANCAWAVLKQAWDTFAANPNLKTVEEA